jgi:hypothetical protein
MDGVSPETCWASYKYGIINKFWYTVVSCWIFLYEILTLFLRHRKYLHFCVKLKFFIYNTNFTMISLSVNCSVKGHNNLIIFQKEYVVSYICNFKTFINCLSTLSSTSLFSSQPCLLPNTHPTSTHFFLLYSFFPVCLSLRHSFSHLLYEKHLSANEVTKQR